MKITECLIAIEHVEARLSTHWNFYSAVILAVGAWLFMATVELNIAQLGTIFFTLIVFFISNITSISVALARIRAMEGELAAIAPEADIKTQVMRDNLRSPGHVRLWFSMIMHGIIDMAALYLIWLKLV